jgi:phosphatidylethanolamine-binding protein (PEBP) family uncharacterized protein
LHGLILLETYCNINKTVAMDFRVVDYKNKYNIIKKKYFCEKNGGHNVIPHLYWKSSKFHASYALIMEDPKAAVGNVVHWFIPTITNKKIIQGKNYYNNFGYHGPCPPPNTGIHEYTFILYGLNKVLNFDANISIKSSKQFEKILKHKKVQILDKSIRVYYYKS